VPDWFEWGQTPLFRRLPKLKGFSNAKFKKHYNIINLSDLETLASKWITEVNQEVLAENGLLSKKTWGIKLLWKGELKSKVNVVLSKASKTAVEAVEKAWGKVELV
jgi:large subunit ribosomal protein L15